MHVIEPLIAQRDRPKCKRICMPSRIERRDLRGAFGLLEKHEIAGKHVTLVDDVMTSASTLRFAARTLMEAKPASISAVVIAVADPKGRAFQFI